MESCEGILKEANSSVDEPTESESQGTATPISRYQPGILYPPRFLMEEDYAPALQHQRRVNPEIHDVIKRRLKNFSEAGIDFNPIVRHPWLAQYTSVSKEGKESDCGCQGEIACRWDLVPLSKNGLKVIDTKGARTFAADHTVQILDNPYENGQ
ncbi:hypothetical protein Tco_0737882 [Tanacetum coccineum]